MIPLSLPDPISVPWYHGTNTSHFENWLVPPPAPSPVDVQHTALFFSADRNFAAAAGSNVCQTTILPSAKVLTPAHGGTDSSRMRQAMTKSNPLAAHCQWLSGDEIWINAWATGQVMRFAFDIRDPIAVNAIDAALRNVANGIKMRFKNQLPDEVLQKQAMQCLTRGWIEQLICEARRLGYQAVHGSEVDRWNEPGSPPVARSWLAVLDANVITKPTWH